MTLIHREARDKVSEREAEEGKAAFNKAAAAFRFHCGTERSSRDICISLRGTRRNLPGRRQSECLQGGEGAGGESRTNEVVSVRRMRSEVATGRGEKTWSLRIQSD